MASFAPPVTPTRKAFDAFYRAYAARDLDALSMLLHDDASWTISGPVDLLPYCGSRRGKKAVLDMVGRLVPAHFEVTSSIPESVLVDGDGVATLNRLTGKRPSDGRVISYRYAQFIRFKDGKVADYCSVIDSFDAAQQVLGHRFSVPGSRMVDDGILVAI